MRLRLVAALVVTAGSLCACDCVVLPARAAMRSADIVFRGTVKEFRDSPRGYETVVFEVNRVWKGLVWRTIELPAPQGDSCRAFRRSLLEAGNELVVYASRLDAKSDLFPMPCNTALVKDVRDLRSLGRGEQPAKN